MNICDILMLFAFLVPSPLHAALGGKILMDTRHDWSYSKSNGTGIVLAADTNTVSIAITAAAVTATATATATATPTAMVLIVVVVLNNINGSRWWIVVRRIIAHHT